MPLCSARNAKESGWPSTEVCVFFHSENLYDLLFDGGESVMPSDLRLAGAQWAINLALGSLSNVSQVFPVDLLQRTPELVTASHVTPLPCPTVG